MIRICKGLIYLSILGLIFGIAGCGAQTGSSTQSAIKVGVIGAFSGPSAEMGKPMQKGIEMAAKEINDAGGISGRKIEIVAYDDEANAAKNATLAQRAIDTDKVVALIAAPNSGTAIATAKVAKERGIPQIDPIAQAAELLQPYNPWVFRITTVNDVDAQKLLKYIKEKGWKRVAVLHDTDAFGLSGEKILKQAIPAEGLEIVADEGHKNGSTDLTAQAIAIKDAKPDAVILWDLGADAAIFAKSLKNINVKFPLLSTRGLLFNVYTEMGGDAVEGTIVTGTLDYSRRDVNKWHNNFIKFGGTEGGINFAGQGYDAMKVLAEGLSKAGAANVEDHEKLRQAIESIKGFKTITGDKDAQINFGPDKHEGADIRNSVLIVVKNGKWTLLEK